MQLQANIQRLAALCVWCAYAVRRPTQCCSLPCPALLPCCRRRKTLQWLGWQLSRNVGLTHIRGREEGREALLLGTPVLYMYFDY